MKVRDFIRKTELNLKDFSSVVINDSLGQIDHYPNVEEAIHYEGDADIVNCWTQLSLFDQKEILYILVDELV